AGLRRGIDRGTLEDELARGTCQSCVERIKPQAGDCFFLPAGVVHALGPGLLVAEIQQASDTTYRLYDWGRLGPDGQPRKLHVEEALEAIDYGYGPVAAQVPQPLEERGRERLVACDKFVLERWRLVGATHTPADGRCRIIALIEGSIEVEGDRSAEPLARGGV